jgi:hypothetical protein
MRKRIQLRVEPVGVIEHDEVAGLIGEHDPDALEERVLRMEAAVDHASGSGIPAV